MDDSFLNNSLLDLDIQEENCVNPDIACRFKIHHQPPPPQSDSIMFNRIPLKRFSGYPTEDAERFLSNFKAYATFSNLETNERRQAATFQLHLDGPAQSWFASLDFLYVHVQFPNSNVSALLDSGTSIKVSKGAKIRNRYNQVPHLTQDTNRKVTNSQLDTTNESQDQMRARLMIDLMSKQFYESLPSNANLHYHLYLGTRLY